VPFGRVAEWLKLFKLLAYAPWFRAVTNMLLVDTNLKGITRLFKKNLNNDHRNKIKK
jgi:hypothetical protein